MPNWPTQSSVLAYKSPYGDPRGKPASKGSAAWESKNLVYVVPPFKMKMGSIPISKFKMHSVCADSMRRVLDRLWVLAGKSQSTIDLWGASQFSGSYNYRQMRNGTRLSMHSFGCAIDLDAARNGLGNRKPRFLQYPKVNEAFQSEDWIWGMDWDDDGKTTDTSTFDGMHWQATKPVG